MSRARSQLGADVIVSTPTGYRLALGAEQVDSSAVVTCAEASARHTRAGDHTAALAGAEEGLAFWDTAPDAEAVPGDPVAELRAERAPLYDSLVRSRALALARLGRRAEAMSPLTEVFARTPATRRYWPNCWAPRRPRPGLRRRSPATTRTGANSATTSAPTRAPASRPCISCCCRPRPPRSGTGCRTIRIRCWGGTRISRPWPGCCAPRG